jgi:hypothetical protein
MAAAVSSEILIPIYENTQRHNPEAWSLNMTSSPKFFHIHGEANEITNK